jgi:hypothetical protein
MRSSARLANGRGELSGKTEAKDESGDRATAAVEPFRVAKNARRLAAIGKVPRNVKIGRDAT